jgi:hypothetical protein
VQISRRGFIRLTVPGVPVLLSACATVAPSAVPTPGRPTAPVATPLATPASAAVSTVAPTTVAAGAASAATNAVTVAGVKLPAYIPPQAARPDLPPSADGMISPGYITYPAKPFKAVSNPPGDGGDVTIFTSVTGAPPSP